MRLTTVPLALLSGMLLAGPAVAQAYDPIGALLSQIPQSPAEDAEEPDTAGQVPRIEPEPQLPAAPAPYTSISPQGRPQATYQSNSGLPTPRPYTPQRPQLTEPVDLMEVGKSPDAPPTVRNMVYDSRLRSSFASAQSFQGPLDGGWTISTPQGQVYALQLVDRGRGVLEGVWRDLRQSGNPAASGFVDEIGRSSGGLTLQFQGYTGPVSVQLSGGYSGVWQGRMTENGRAHTVNMQKIR